MTTLQARMDIRGFLRIQEHLATQLKIKNTPYADIFVNTTTQQISIIPTKKIKETSFRFIPSNSGFLIYLKGAMKLLDIPVVPGSVSLIQDKDKLIFSGKKKTKKQGTWEIFPCRNSVGIPMISIDNRGTLILDKRCIELIDTKTNNTLTADFDAKKKMFSLTFSKKGFINVRTIASHANISFMGTLSSFGLPIPQKRIRTGCSIQGKTLSFNASELIPKKK
ncbi:MAG TPA: hypothetical protein PLT31_04630 [Fibrobacteraceae bacterium]|jgi:hypothetical protein|nr:hypothetical protein [Fibrobacter sp.]HPW94458.1 hypothetical protein [Fibrobacteraceae bacterium]HQB64511.1 hypothetical protein [Fibrobacteraceae bacterium]